MNSLSDSIVIAFKLIVLLDKEVYHISFVSLKFAFISVFLASFISVPLGIAIGRLSLNKRKLLTAFINTLSSFPTVVIGLFVASMLSRSGPLGSLGLLFTPTAIIIGQTILAIPVISAIVLSGTSLLDGRLYETLLTLEKSRFKSFVSLLREIRYLVLTAILTGFGRIIGEVGVSMILGGNVRWFTRTITTSIALETSKGDFELALALGLILIFISGSVNYSLYFVKSVRKRNI